MKTIKSITIIQAILFRLFSKIAILAISFVLLVLYSKIILGQSCEISYTVILENRKGGFYAGQKIAFYSKSGELKFEQTSNAKGTAEFTLPCNSTYDLRVSNYTGSKEVRIPSFNGAQMKKRMSYEPDMIAKQEKFKLNEEEITKIDKMVSRLPDTIIVRGYLMKTPSPISYYSKLTLSLKDIEGGPLVRETIWLTGIKNGKTIKATTSSSGRIQVYLPKGDTYTTNFKHNKNYSTVKSSYLTGTSKINSKFSYLGTVEIERRMRIEAKRIAEEEKRLLAEKKRFTDGCKKLGITEEEGRKLEAEESIKNMANFNDTVVSAVLNRNQWDEKLIVCDLTGSMQPYSAQLSLWYLLNFKQEKNLQFVFFNDGDNTPDSKKVIGNTGGIYYTPSKGVDHLTQFAASVSSKGYGGDCPENNMEALIEGIKLASPYKELVMIADNNAPVKDIELLSQFKEPVHIILCGVNKQVLPHHLQIAWKTGGSVHTMEEDITNIAKLMEGQDLVVNGGTYRIMGGEFVAITKL